MRFIDRPLSKVTSAMCQAELERAKAAHNAYANAVRAMKRLIEAKTDLGDMGDAEPPEKGRGDGD